MIYPMVPYPLRASGMSIRHLPVIRYLGKRHWIDIIVIDDGHAERKHIEALGAYCQSVTVIANPKFERHNPVGKLIAQLTMLLPWSPPRRCSFYGGHKISRRIAELTSGTHYDSLVCVGTPYTPYVGSVSADRVVVDFIDSPTLSIRRSVLGSLKPYWLHKYESWKMKRWEAKVIRNSTACIYISPVDAQEISSRLTSGGKRYVISNGISVEGYSPFVEEGIKSPNIGFLGNMSYLPNVEAVHWLYEEVFSPLRNELPDLSLYIIGRDPVDSVRDLGRKESVVVTGTVEDTWSYVNAVDVFVFPLWRGTGLKNKVLEVMYAKRPVVTSRIGSEGIGATPGRDLLICSSPLEFREEVLRLLTSPDERSSLGNSGYMLVREKFSWKRIWGEFESVITGEIAQSSDEIDRDIEETQYSRLDATKKFINKL